MILAGMNGWRSTLFVIAQIIKDLWLCAIFCNMHASAMLCDYVSSIVVFHAVRLLPYPREICRALLLESVGFALPILLFV